MDTLTARHVGTGTFQATPLMRRYVADVLNSGRISYGPYSRQFEQQFAALHGCQYGVLSNSGTSSLLVALQALKELHGWPDGARVVVPAVTFVATVNVVLQNRLMPVLCDVEPDCYGIDTTCLETMLRRHRPVVIIPVHTFGQPCDMSDIKYLAGWRAMKIIEDSCEAVAVGHKDKPVGAWGDIGCFSTYTAHLITTGIGGMSITNNPDYAKTMRSLVNHGLSYDDLSGGDNGFTPVKTRRDFVFDRIGHSFRISEFEAALGLAQLETVNEMIMARRRNAAYLSDGLAFYQDRLQLPATRPNTGHSWMMFPLVCRQVGVRNRLTRFLEQRSIETRRMLPLVSQPVYRGLWEPDTYPVARWIEDNGYYCGVHQNLTQDDLDYIIQAHADFFKAA